MDAPSAHAGMIIWFSPFIAVVDVVGVSGKNRKGVAPLTNVRLRKFVIV